MEGLKVLVTAGPTREKIDPVRYITNHSSGKMGYAVAENAAKRGAEVTLISGPVHIKAPSFVKLVAVESAEDMYNAVTKHFADCDILVKAAAVADYTVPDVSNEKIKKKDDDLSLALARTKDILKAVGEHKAAHQAVCGFSMETSNLIENSRKKLVSKNCDMIIANNLKDSGAGFGVDTNKITIITENSIENLAVMTKREAAGKILDAAVSLLKSKRECDDTCN